MKTLHLNVKRKWFDMIQSGGKKEEYRELKPYWASRLAHVPDFYDTITFSNGYAKDRPQVVVKLIEVWIGEGKPEWGAVPRKLYYVMKLGKIIQDGRNKTNIQL